MAYSPRAAACGSSAVAASRALLSAPEPRYESTPMKVDGKHTRTIWLEPDGWSVGAIDQTRLPHRFETVRLATLEDAVRAIATMQVRGARPTAINLKWALDQMTAAVAGHAGAERVAVAYARAAAISDEDVAINQAI